MPLFRRKPLDPEIERLVRAFTPAASAVEAAQRSLLAAIPTSRDEGVPLAQALAAFTEQMAAARAAMDAWREPRLDTEWRACERALDEATAAAARLRLSAAGLSFEALNARVGEVLDPLEAFADAERTLRRL